MSQTLSVGIPNYNHSSFLERCLGAVMSQERRPDEVIIYDDCSTDDSREVMVNLQKRWPNLKLEYGMTNLGVVDTVNTLAKLATGDWIHLLGADDVVMPGFYKLAMQKVEQYPQGRVLFGGFIGVEEESGQRWMETADPWLEHGYHKPYAMIWNLFNKAPAMFGLGFTYIWNRQTFIEVGGLIPELKMYDELTFRIIAAKYGAIYLGGVPLSCVRASFQTFSGRARKDKTIYAKVLSIAAQMMREQYADIFPERYVRRWERKVSEELGFKRMAPSRWLRLAVAWGLRWAAKKTSRLLGR